MKKYSKKYFPLCAEMNVTPNIELFKKTIEGWSHMWADSFTAHGKDFTANQPELAAATIGFIDHIPLTGPSQEAANLDTAIETYYNTTPRQRFKSKGASNEKNWGEPRDYYKGTDLHKHITEMFIEKPIRLRLSKMKPGAEVPPHFDYGTQFAVRFILPVSGNKGVIHRFHVGGETYEYEMENGKCYFLNIGYNHSVSHTGTEDRIYLIGSLDGQRDIENLWKAI